MSRILPFIALIAPLVAEAAAPPLVPVTGYLVDSTGAPVDASVTLHLALYTDGTTTTTLWSEDQSVVVDNGQFTAYLGEDTALALDTFRSNGSVFLGVAVDAGTEMTPRFEIATAPFAAFAQYCDDAATVGGIDPLDLVVAGDPLDWTDLVGVPPTLLDGDQDSVYTSGTGLTLSPGRQFAVDQATIEGWARAVAYDAVGELRTDLDAIYAAKQACTVGQIAVADSAGGWVCTNQAGVTAGSAFYVQNQTGTAQAASFNISGTAAIAGDVGIGNTTPVTRLHVTSPAAAGGGGTVSTLMVEATSGDSALAIKSAGTGRYAYQTFAQGLTGQYEMGVTGSTDPAGGAVFYLNSNVQSGAGGASLVVKKSGYVGVGTTAPVAPLHVASPSAVSAGGTVATLMIEATGGNSALAIKSAGLGSYAYQTYAQGTTGQYEMGVTGTTDPAGGGVFYLNPNVQSGSNSAAFAVKKNGNVGIGTTNPLAKLDVGGQVAVNGSPAILWRDIATPIVKEFSFTGAQTFNVTVAGMPVGARYILADIFATASTNDHQVFSLGRGVTAVQSWVNLRGDRPSLQFGNVARHAINLVYTGETDGFTSNYGTWYGSQAVPLNANLSFDFTNAGNSGSNGWIYMVIRGYSL